MKIFKYVLSLADTQVIDMPVVMKPLAVQMQGGNCCMWALVDDSQRITRRVRINIFGTGNPIPDNKPIGDYVSTFQIPDYGLVFHAFVVPAGDSE
jgi:hypothetical protein